MKYPSRDVLMALGEWGLTAGPMDQKMIAAGFRRILAREILP